MTFVVDWALKANYLSICIQENYNIITYICPHIGSATTKRKVPLAMHGNVDLNTLNISVYPHSFTRYS